MHGTWRYVTGVASAAGPSPDTDRSSPPVCGKASPCRAVARAHIVQTGFALPPLCRARIASVSRLSLVPRSRPVRPSRSLTLLESGRTISRTQLLQTALGMLLHGSALVGGAAWAARVPMYPSLDPSRTRLPVFLAPERKPIAPTPQERLQYVGLAAGDVPVPSERVAADGTAGGPQRLEGEEAAAAPVPEAEPVYEEFVLSEIDVDSAAASDPESGGPEYPPELLTKNVEGVVAARFVVDSTGHVKPGSFVAFESTHPLFTKAVEDALPRMKFRPAYVGKKRVQQLVVQSFAFRIARGDTAVGVYGVPAVAVGVGLDLTTAASAVVDGSRILISCSRSFSSRRRPHMYRPAAERIRISRGACRSVGGARP